MRLLVSVTFALLLVLTQGCCCCDRCCDTRCKAAEADDARAALELSRAVHLCKTDADPETYGLGAFTPYKVARAKVEKDGGRLCVWVGGVCGVCVRKLSDHLHAKLPAWDGIDGVGVVLIEGDGKGNSTVLKVWEGFPPAQEIRDTRLKRRQAQAEPAAAEVICLPPIYLGPPVYYFPAAPFGCPGCR